MILFAKVGYVYKSISLKIVLLVQFIFKLAELIEPLTISDISRDKCGQGGIYFFGQGV